MSNYDNADRGNEPRNIPAFFTIDISIEIENCIWISKSRSRYLESEAMLGEIGPPLGIVPLEFHASPPPRMVEM